MAIRTRRNWERQNGPTFYHAWGNWEEGQYVEGTIVGATLDRKYKRTNYKIKVEDFDIECVRPDGTELKVGDVLTVNGTGGLAGILGVIEGDKNYGEKPNLVPIGTAVKLQYEGYPEMTSGEYEGSNTHSVAISMDKGTPELDSMEEEEDDDL